MISAAPLSIVTRLRPSVPFTFQIVVQAAADSNQPFDIFIKVCLDLATMTWLVSFLVLLLKQMHLQLVSHTYAIGLEFV